MIAALGDMFETVDVYRWKLDWKQLSGYLLLGAIQRGEVEAVRASNSFIWAIVALVWEISIGFQRARTFTHLVEMIQLLIPFLSNILNEWIVQHPTTKFYYLSFFFSPVQCSRIEASRCKPGKSNGLQLAEIVVVCNRIKSTREINSDTIELMLQEGGKKSLAVIKLTSWWHDRDAV